MTELIVGNRNIVSKYFTLVDIQAQASYVSKQVEA